MSLITTQDAKDHLGITDDPPDLPLKIAVAEEVVRDYVNQRVPGSDPDGLWASEVASWDLDATPPVPPPLRVQQAVLLQLGDLWRFRGDDEASEEPKREPGELARGVTALLYRLRDPAIA